MLTSTTQPAHVAIMLVALLVVASLNKSSDANSNSKFFKFIYAATTAAHFGSQIWMTFASGIYNAFYRLSVSFSSFVLFWSRFEWSFRFQLFLSFCQISYFVLFYLCNFILFSFLQDCRYIFLFLAIISVKFKKSYSLSTSLSLVLLV